VRCSARFPNDTILDDVLIPMRIVQQGYLVQFEQEARAYQAVSRTTRQEYVRKVRTIAGRSSCSRVSGGCCSPLKNALWFETVSHKGLRLLLPSSTWRSLRQLRAVARAVLRRGLALQTAFYAAAILGHERACGAPPDLTSRALRDVLHAVGDRGGVPPLPHRWAARDVGQAPAFDQGRASVTAVSVAPTS
jgi:hypothetical protein